MKDEHIVIISMAVCIILASVLGQYLGLTKTPNFLIATSLVVSMFASFLVCTKYFFLMVTRDL